VRSLKSPSVVLLPMVLGCYADGDGSGLAHSRDLDTGQARLDGFFLPGACGATDGERDPRALPLAECAAEPWWPRLAEAARALEAQQRDAIELEFVVQDGQLWILGARPVLRAGTAACAIAAVFMTEGLLDPAEAVARIRPSQFAEVVRPSAGGLEPQTAAGRGLGVSPGVASGIATFDPARAVERSKEGDCVVLIRAEARPGDVTALLASAAIVTARGGRTSHAAVVARAIGRPCVVGVAGAVIDQARGRMELGGVTIADGDLVTVDGAQGLLAKGGCLNDSPGDGHQLDWAAQRLLAAADAERRMQVLVNADTADDAAAARRAGAAGIGLCRTEHMLLGDRQRLLAEILLGPNHRTAQESLDDLLTLQRADFAAILAAMDGLPVTARLLDPPRHEFLPDRTGLAVRIALGEARGEPDPAAGRQLRAAERLSESNPMLGVRGVRLGVLLPWLYEMQIRALLEATVTRLHAGGDPRPQLLVPMAATAQELRPVRTFATHLLSELQPLADRELTLPVGVMIEVPRAALTAAELAGQADFFSFGTNDLTQLTWGMSRDDTDMAILRPYEDLRLIDASPFERLDRAGVGHLIAMAVEAGRRVRPGMPMGVCGEHAADPDSIEAFHDWGLDYVSCSRQDLAVARYAAGHATRSPRSEAERGTGGGTPSAVSREMTPDVAG
jgi:pyruvate,orthophosphate dikinase